MAENRFGKLFKQPLAVISLGYIFFNLLLAVFAFVLAPDQSPESNEMVIELNAKPPGYHTLLLRVPKPGVGKDKGNWLAGYPARFNNIPISTYHFQESQLVVNHYIDDGLSDTLVYTLAQLLPESSAKSSTEAQQQAIIHANIFTRTYFLGTDRYGRDILSRLIAGARISLSVGLIAVLLSVTIGFFMGAAAGFYGGMVDKAVMFLINILWSIPTLLLVFAITLTIGKGFIEVFIAIGLSMWVGAARLIRGQVLVIRELDYITAARALGLSNFRIITRHILPNIAGPLIVVGAGNFAAAILTEAGLSFLGIGVQPPRPSWGLMIKEHYNFLLTGNPLPALIPGFAIMLLVYAFNILGNALRDIYDVKG